MANNLEVTRSIQFVSIDTHPANNSLVVTYDILVTISDGASKRELSRRNKRSHFQVHIKEFDQLGEKDFTSGKIDLGRISSEVIKKCPILLSSSSSTTESQHLEDIQLHLLYLINRRQSSLLSKNYEQKDQRPASSISNRSSGFRSGSRSSTRLQSGARGRPIRQQQAGDGDPSSTDIYSFIRAKEAQNQACGFDIDGFVEELNEFLDSIEASKSKDLANQISELSANQTGSIDRYLDGLYGDRIEQFVALSYIRRLCYDSSDENKLSQIGSNGLLLSAMIRNLRHSNIDEYYLREFILSCLIRITAYEDVYLDLEPAYEPIDLLKILSDLLAEQVREDSSKAMRTNRLVGRQINNHYYLCAILVVIINLFKLAKNCRPDIQETILCHSSQDSGNQLGLILSDLFQLIARDLIGEIRLMGKPIQLIQSLHANVLLLQQTSGSKEFIQQIRCKNEFFESVVNLLNCLQLSRPGSGKSLGQEESMLVQDRQTLNELFHLELDLLMLVNNLLMNSRVRAKFIKRKLLKPVLRNLVLFLASSSSSAPVQAEGSTSSRWLDANNFSSTNYNMITCGSSLILVVPFRSLYELSCDKSVRLELYKSKIIMKCLLEYLVSSVQFLEDDVRLIKDQPIRESIWVDGIGPTNVCHYILGVWINLSSLKEAPIYNYDEFELKDLLYEFIEIILDRLRYSLVRSPSNSISINSRYDESNLIYLNMKLLSNLSQHMRFTRDDYDLYKGYLIRLSELSEVLFNSSRQHLKPYLIECLTSLSNLISARPSPLAEGDQDQKQEDEQAANQSLPDVALASMIGRLFQLKCEDFVDDDNDDLLLLCIQLIGILANKLEICHLELPVDTTQQELVDESVQFGRRQRINVEMLRACNFVLDSKLNDHELIIYTLYSLSQLMNHSQFLKTLLLRAEGDTDTDGDANAADDDADDGDGDAIRGGPMEGRPQDAELESNLGMFAELLVHKLANLMLYNGDVGISRALQITGDREAVSIIARLALELLNLFRQLEQQTSIDSWFVQRIRFAYYNSKWLAAIQASREALDRSSPGPSSSPFVAAKSDPADRREFDANSRAASDAASWFGSRLSFGQRIEEEDEDEDEDDEEGSGQLMFADHRTAGGEDETIIGGAKQELDIDGSTGSASSSSFGEAPDLNVIDTNSMIKHLSSRRQLRHRFNTDKSGLT